MSSNGTLKTCENGHQFYKASDCPACPFCEKESKPTDSFLSLLGAPARRALEGENIGSVGDLSKYSEKEILSLHGLGKSTIPKLVQLLSENGLTFRK